MPRRKKEKPLDPEALGEAWRGAMRESIESVPGLIWERVKRRHKIDLADRDRATALQVYRLLLPVIEQGDVPLTAKMLRELIDDRVTEIFGRN